MLSFLNCFIILFQKNNINFKYYNILVFILSDSIYKIQEPKESESVDIFGLLKLLNWKFIFGAVFLLVLIIGDSVLFECRALKLAYLS